MKVTNCSNSHHVSSRMDSFLPIYARDGSYVVLSPVQMVVDINGTSIQNWHDYNYYVSAQKLNDKVVRNRKILGI